MTLTRWFAGVALVTGTTLAACGGAIVDAGPDGGVGSDATFGVGSDATFGVGPDATFGVGPGADGGSSPSGSATPEDASQDPATADPFSGVWVGVQAGTTVEISNAAGCMLLKDSVNGVVCDECVGSYVAGAAGVASMVADCKPLGACSVSPPHHDTGTFTRGNGGQLTFFYQFAGGTASVDLQPTQGAPGNVCRIVDGGAGH